MYKWHNMLVLFTKKKVQVQLLSPRQKVYFEKVRKMIVMVFAVVCPQSVLKQSELLETNAGSGAGARGSPGLLDPWLRRGTYSVLRSYYPGQAAKKALCGPGELSRTAYLSIPRYLPWVDRRPGR